MRHTRSPGRMREVFTAPLPKRSSRLPAPPAAPEDAAALFGLPGTAPVGGVEDHAIARLQTRQSQGIGFGRSRHACRRHASHAAHAARRDGAARGRSPPPGDSVPVRKYGPRPREYTCSSSAASAARRLAAPSGPGIIHRLAIGARGQRHVVGVLVAAFDLQRGDADARRSPGPARARTDRPARAGSARRPGARRGHPRSSRTAGGRPARTGRDWRCGRPRLPTRSTGRNRPRTARRARRSPARIGLRRGWRASRRATARAPASRGATPRLCASRTPSALVMLICVLPWISRSGAMWRASVTAAQILHDDASAPASAIAASARAASSSSWSKTSVLKVT